MTGTTTTIGTTWTLTTTEHTFRRLRRATAFPARWRITAWILLTMFVLLVVVFVVVRNVLLRDVDVRANNDVAQETAEFRRFSAEGVDPATSRPFETVRRMLEIHLARQSALQGEVMAGYADGTIIEMPGIGWPGSSDSQRRVLEDIAAGSATSGVTQTPRGELRWGTVPVTNANGGRGVFVIGMFVEPAREVVDRTMRTIALVGLGGLLLATGIAYLVAGRILAPVRTVRVVADEISESDLTSRVPVRGNDDIADLARTFNSMLDRLELAYRTQRRFVDDAGHELRTPITVIRGHLELLSDDPAERRATLALVDSELVRMSRIVSDLLMLAKAEQPDFVVPRDTDVATLMLDIESKVAALGERRWLMMEVAEGTALLDPERITQAMLQFAANAVGHTDDGSAIRLGSRFTGEGSDRRLSMWITDEGPGVRPDETDRIFQRFQRGDPAARDETRRAGAGLGLAIVTAIAEGHHGIAWVTSVPGEGATFGIDVPAPADDRPSVKENP